MEKAGRGEAVITHDSSEYGLVADSENSKQNLKIILPGHDGYTQLRAPVDQVFHIQQITNPKLEPAPSSLSGKRKREQPQGLRMRWKPAGFISGNPGAVGDEDDSEGDIIIIEEPTRKRPQFKVLSKVPSNSPGQEKSKKRKNRDEDDLPDKNPKKTKTTKSPSSEKPTMNSKDGTISEPDSNDAAAKEISKEEEYKSKREKSSPSKHKSDSRRHESKSIKKREGKEKSKSHDITSGNIGKRQEVKEKGESRKERSSISKTKSESDTHKSKSKDRNDEKEKSKSGDKAGSEKSLENIEKKERSRDRETRSKSQSKDKAERNRDREKKKHKHVEKEKAKSEEP